ncbi:DUF305 domain-containing protein [Streptomyces sp. NPDC001068]|uniref:DUF305 domain-containing protein n=1 Tax=Streptomyces sp. NPDC001068 TaxID=3364544 RepID=UPI00367FF16A
MTTARTRTRAVLVALTASAALVLTACGGDATPHGTTPHGGASVGASASDTASGAHNAQDVGFAQHMIRHHRQALEMAALAADRAASVRVKDLAGRIENAQDPEIRTMSGWLRAWGEDVPTAGTDHSGHTGTTGMTGMTGMTGTTGTADDTDMSALRKAVGTDFDAMFLTMMVQHHRGAVEMATTERSGGRYTPAIALAGSVVIDQSAEIKEMNRLLGKG